MNKRGASAVLGFALLVLLFLFIITAFVTIEPLKESLNTIRGEDGLNCKGTPDFNQTAYDEDTGDELKELTKRPTCFATGMSMVWFIGAFIVAAFTWVVSNWRKIK